MNANFRERVFIPFLKLVSKSLFLLALGAFLYPYSGYTGPPGSLLCISATNGTANVSWTGNGYWLQAADLLDDPLSWYNSPWSAEGTDPQFNSHVPMDSSMRFFRLVSSSFLPPPTGMRATAGDSLMYVSWDAVSNAITYNLYLASAPGITPLNYSSLPDGMKLSGLNQTQTVFDSLTPGVRYYFVVTAVNAQGESASSNKGSDQFGPQGQVHGSFYTPVFDGMATNQIFVPGVTVAFQTNGVTLAQATTDGNGQFIADAVPAGVYQICWNKAGFISGCNTQLVTVSNDVVVLDPQEIDPQSGPGTGLVFGDVKLRDGSVPSFAANDFGTSLSTTVTLKDGAGNVVAATAVNNWGQYLFAGAPTGTNLILNASTEAAFASSNINTTVMGEANLVLPNTPPVIQSIVARLNGQVVSYAPTGAMVQLAVTATDAENDFMHYTWLGGPGADGLISVDSSNLSLALPGTNGVVKVFVQAGDGHGGYAHTQFNLNVEDQLVFNGYVEDTSGNVIVNAAVSVDSASTLSDTNGFFSLTLPTSQNQFLLNITATGYSPFYRVLDDSAAGETYQLAPLETTCTNWTGAPITVSDSSGTTLALQANSLEITPGVPYLGPICVSIATYDPCANIPPYPAGNMAIDNLGNTNWITPQVTAFVSISDAGGDPLMINPGLPATLILPLGQTCMPMTNPPCVLPAWVWNPTNAVWQMTGLATNLAGDCASGPFAGPMLQMGLQAVAAPAATCQVGISVDRTINFPIILRLSSQAPTIEINQVSLAGLSGKGVTVPVNQAVTFQLLSPKEAPNDYFTDPNNKATIRPEAKKTVILEVTKTFTKDDKLTLGLSAQIPLLTPDRVGQDDHFLTYNSGDSRNNFDRADAYYQAIGFPRVGANTFLTWMKKNGDAAALYFNATDLGFARSMHMKTKPGIDGKMDIAYYVVNYVSMADAVADLAGKKPAKQADATVAMDYAAELITNITAMATNVIKNRITKFYVFDQGSSAERALRPNAELDPAGGKIVPNLCVTCHGSSPVIFKNVPRVGETVKPPNGDTKAHFIPFDLESFTYDSGTGVQQAQFRELNRGIYLSTPLTSAMKELIEGWYSGALNNANNNNFTTDFVPTNWSGNAAQKALYLNAVRVSCRGCHTMRENISFNTYKSLNEEVDKENAVCKTLIMPNAQRTFTIFWGSMAANLIKNGVTPDQPTLLKNQFNWGACPAAAP